MNRNRKGQNSVSVMNVILWHKDLKNTIFVIEMLEVW